MSSQEAFLTRVRRALHKDVSPHTVTSTPVLE